LNHPNSNNASYRLPNLLDQVKASIQCENIIAPVHVPPRDGSGTAPHTQKQITSIEATSIIRIAALYDRNHYDGNLHSKAEFIDGRQLAFNCARCWRTRK